jgi:hypothetical protein
MRLTEIVEGRFFDYLGIPDDWVSYLDSLGILTPRSWYRRDPRVDYVSVLFRRSYLYIPRNLADKILVLGYLPAQII